MLQGCGARLDVRESAANIIICSQGKKKKHKSEAAGPSMMGSIVLNGIFTCSSSSKVISTVLC